MFQLRGLQGRRSSIGSNRGGNAGSGSPPRDRLAARTYREARDAIFEFATPLRKKVVNEIAESDNRDVDDDFAFDISNPEREMFNTTTPTGQSQALQDVFEQTESVIENLHRNVTVRVPQRIDQEKDDTMEPSPTQDREPGSKDQNKNVNVSTRVSPPGGEPDDDESDDDSPDDPPEYPDQLGQLQQIEDPRTPLPPRNRTQMGSTPLPGKKSRRDRQALSPLSFTLKTRLRELMTPLLHQSDHRPIS